MTENNILPDKFDDLDYVKTRKQNHKRRTPADRDRPPTDKRNNRVKGLKNGKR